MASLSISVSTACQGPQAQVVLNSVSDAPGSPAGGSYTWTVINQATGTDYGTAATGDEASAGSIAAVPAGTYVARVYATYPNGSTATSPPATRTVDCSGSPDALVLDSHSHTDETSAGNDGTATIQASGGAAPLTAALLELSLSQPATSGQSTTFTGLPSGGPFTLRITDNAGQQVEAQETIGAYREPVAGCTDEYADNYDPAATIDATCTYLPRWRSAWGPAGVACRVAAVAGQQAAYVEAELRVGFRPGHPLAADRPLGDPLTLRATVGPDGYATFVLGPYLRSQLGAPDGAGGRRLDLNSLTAYTSDLYVGYELRRADSGQLVEHGYALNAAVSDAQVMGAGLLTPFAVPPVWPGFDDYPLASLGSAGAYGVLVAVLTSSVDVRHLPCPPNPLPVRWLAPGGGYGTWIFQGKPALADVVSDGQRYREALTGESRWNERGEARRTYTASSGPYRGAALAEGLATLARSPQVWVKPDAGSDVWVPVTLESATFPVRQWGVQRNEISITFSEAAAWYAQGQ